MSQTVILFLNVLIIATCGLVYELLAGTVASYLLGDSIFQFSTIIGVYLFAMGVGSWLAKFVDKNLVNVFIEVELAVALLGGFSALIFFAGFSFIRPFHVVLYGVVFLIGAMVGLEIPLLMRILKDNLEFKELVSRVLAFDYLGALVASLAFPLLLIPQLGVMRTPLAMGILNAAVGLWATFLLRPLVKGNVVGIRARAVLVIALLIAGIIFAEKLLGLAEEEQYQGKVLLARNTPYQRIVLTHGPLGVYRLHLNGHLQFSSLDEHRYHEALVHPAMMTIEPGRPVKRVLILGGGDGLAMREVLRYPGVEHVLLVDLDPGMTKLCGQFVPLARLNQFAYNDPRVQVINQDAYIWVQSKPAKPEDRYDVVIIDFPDPHNFSLGKLYTTRFYRLLREHLKDDSAIGIQCTSPFWAPKTFWCIHKTMEAAGYYVRPYSVPVPSFGGMWGFGLARLSEFAPPDRIPTGLKGPDGKEVKLRYLNEGSMRGLFYLPEDLKLPEDETVEVNRLDNQVVVKYHDSEWKRFAR